MYISVLATEYRLLKNYNQDYSETIKLLYYAILTFNRLDETAESYYRNGVIQQGDLNGFFVRNDFTPDFVNKYFSLGTNPFFKASNIPFWSEGEHLLSTSNPDGFENSEDNVWHMLEALALVNKLLDTEVVDGVSIDFKKMAKDITKNIVGYMSHDNNMLYDACKEHNTITQWCSPMEFSWYLKNNVTDKLVSAGNGISNKGEFDGTMLSMSYGFAKAANNILNENKFEGMPSQIVPVFPYLVPVQIPSSQSLFNYIIGSTVSDLYLSLYAAEKTCVSYLGVVVNFSNIILCLEGNEQKSILWEKYGDIPYSVCTQNSSKIRSLFRVSHLDDYKYRSVCATGNIGIGNNTPYQLLIQKQKDNNIYKYEHLPLLWCVLNDINSSNSSLISQDDRDIIFNMLRRAPGCGPRFLNKDSINNEWSIPNTLITPEKRYGGYFNYHDSTEFNGLDYMLLHNLYWLTNPVSIPKDINPLLLCTEPGHVHQAIATNDIVSSQLMNLNNNSLNIYAGNSITLLPGFETTGTGNVYFDISEVTTTNEPVYYHKLSLKSYENACPDRLK